MIFFAIILLVIFKYGLRFNCTIKDNINRIAKAISNPRIFFKNIFSLVKGINGNILWIFLSIILLFAIIYLIVFQLKKKNIFNNICKRIVEDIKNDLRISPLDENGRKSITEKQIIVKYAQKYNIKYDTFTKKYLKQLYELGKNDKSLKISKINNTPEDFVIKWELRE